MITLIVLPLATFRLIDDSMSCSFVVLHLLTCCSFNHLQGHLSCNIYRRTYIPIILITSVHIATSLPEPSPFWFPFSAVEERNTYINHISKYNACTYILRRIWRYQRDNQNPYIEEEQTTQWPIENVQKDKERSTKHTHKTKNRVTRTPLNPGWIQVLRKVSVHLI
jgi:hypothetical protein